MSRLPVTLLACALAAGAATAGQTTAQIDRKRAEILSTVAELRSRPTEAFAPERAAERARTLDRLEAYARTGVFPVNEAFPTRRMPSFFDTAGTRCAIANLMDETDAGDLVLRLAAIDNHAFLAELTDDPILDDVEAWLVEHGLTLEEACFIQGPGFDADPPPEPTPTPGQTLPGPGSPVTPNPGGAGPGTGGGPRGPTTGGGRRRRASAPTSTWESWWAMNRDAFTNVRARFHDTRVVTGPQADDSRARRPSDDLVRAQVLPTLVRLSKEDDAIAATALMARARLGHEDDAAMIVPAIEEYLRHKDAQYREFAVLAIGVLGGDAAEATLIDVVTDRRGGRRLLRETNRLPERVRALAAIGLSQCGGADAAEALLDVVQNEKASRIDLRSASVIALGILGRDEAVRARVLPALHRLLTREDGPTQVLAHLPLALGRIADPASVPALLGIVARFKGRVEVRRSAALALGRFVDAADEELLEGLIASARRDPDPLVRQFAILSLGELSAGEVPPELVTRLHQFHIDGVTGFFKQQSDRPWHALAAGLFARHRPDARGKVIDALRAEVRTGGSSELRAACVLALGLGDDRMASVLLRQQLKESGNAKIIGYSAEALGLLGDAAAEPQLLELVKDGGDSWVRYRAAIALGQLASVRSVSELVSVLKDGNDDSVRAALTRAIGEIGDVTAIDGLVGIATDERQVDMTRARAAAALGLTAQESDASWIELVKRGYNDSIATPSLREVLNLF